jgi:phosphoenolpyruvate---glycerone phosphotransferase subunit DhaL
MDNISPDDIKAVFTELKRVMDENKDYLTEIDATVGDGDLGITMQKGFRAANEQLQAIGDQETGTILSRVGMAIAQAAPSTMGTLVGTGFMRAGKTLKDKKDINLADFSQAMEQFVEGIMMRGKAKPGDKTIIDSLLPAVRSLQSSAGSGKSVGEAMQLAYQASMDGLEATRTMTPQHGKQVAHREKSLGLHDPGATVGMLIMQTFANYFR